MNTKMDTPLRALQPLNLRILLTILPRSFLFPILIQEQILSV